MTRKIGTAKGAKTEMSIAQTSLDYDLQPYTSLPFAQSAPTQLAGIARLFDLDPPEVATAQVLELGCSSGGNIIPLAARYPQATFVGIDLSRVQIAAGRTRIEQLGLTNIKLICQSFTETDPAAHGQFDYITAHGVYSWVPEEVREAMLGLIGKLLAPAGVAYVSYNVYPGWRVPQALRDVLMLTVPRQGAVAQRAAAAREMIAFIGSSAAADSLYGQGLREWVERLKGLPDDYIGHEFLEATNDPCTVIEFIEAASKADLAYLGESDIAAMVAENHSPELAQQLRTITGNNIAGMEQMMDLITGRTFRQSLLVRQEAAPRIDRALNPERLEKLHFIADATLQASDGEEGDLFTAIDGASRTVTATDPVVGKALGCMAASYPASFNLEDLYKATQATSAQTKAAIGDVVFKMLLAGMVRPLADPVHTASTLAARPVAFPLARQDAAQGSGFTTNMRHERVQIDPAAAVLIPLLDGKAAHQDLACGLVDAAKRGVIQFSREGSSITEPQLLEQIAQEAVPQVLAGVMRAGLLVD